MTQLSPSSRKRLRIPKEREGRNKNAWSVDERTIVGESAYYLGYSLGCT
jgi:hypothetical protein